MKLFTQSLAAAAIFATLSMGSAFANTSAQAISAEINSMLGSNNVKVVVVDGVATLSGQTECAIGKTVANKVAMNNADVDKVINLITSN